MTLKEKKRLSIIERQRTDFELFVIKMNNSSKIDFKNLVRTLRPYFKTTTISTMLFLNFKNTEFCIKLELLPFKFQDVRYFDVSCTKFPNRKYSFSVESHKELLLKLNKHNLF